MPMVVTLLAIRAGLRDAREGQPAFLWAILTNPAERGRSFRSAVKDVGRIVVVAVVLDSVYQLAVLHAFHVVQLLIVVVACSILPYVLIRGPVTRLRRGRHRGRAQQADAANAATNPLSRCDSPRGTPRRTS